MKTLLRIVLLGLALLGGLHAQAQEASSRNSPSTVVLFNTQLGSEVQAGRTLAPLSFGPSVELTFGRLFETQGNFMFGPVSGGGHFFEFSALGVAWMNERIGLLGGIEHTWVRTSQLDSSGWSPMLGAAFHDRLYKPGRLYASYLFPTGCGAVVPDSSCPHPSSRTQGLRVVQEIHLISRFRIGVQADVVHFCGNSDGARSCRLSGDALVRLRFEFASRSNPQSY